MKAASTVRDADRSAAVPPSLVKISVLARLSAVPAATIKHYLREGLLPQSSVKTSRNMALYDTSLVERIGTIKSLQRTQFLPLKVIRGVIEGKAAADDDAETRAAIERALDAMAPRDSRTRSQLLSSGLPERDLEFFIGLGILTPTPNDREDDGEDVFSGDDLALLRVLGAARKAGITRQMLPPEIIGGYLAAIQDLVRVELRMFREGLVPHARGELPRLTESATRLSEQLVVLIRRKLLLPTLGAMIEETPKKPALRRKRSRRVRAR